MNRALASLMFWVLGAIAASGYGILGYALFSGFFSRGDYVGPMFLSFLVGVPFSGCATSAFFLAYYMKTSVGSALLRSLGLFAVGVLICALFFKEGAICIILLAGIAFVPALFGALLGVALAAIRFSQMRNTLAAVVAVLPMTMGGLEKHYVPSDGIHEMRRSVYIEASPDIVWRNILSPTNIRRDEIDGGFAYTIGLPYPIEARTMDLQVGGIRKSRWERGVAFDEEITMLEPNRHIAWIYHFTDQSFPPGSLDDHVKVGGRYFDLRNTSYTLRPTGSGTSLDMSVTYRVSTNFNWYAEPWAAFFIADTSIALLNFYKRRSEAAMH
jgi:hypothetical protein